MAIVFTKQKRNQRALIIFSVLIILVSAIVLWWAFLREEAPHAPSKIALPPAKKIEINFEALEKTKEFQPFTEIQPLQAATPTEGEDGSPGTTIGRENPFLPY